MRQPPALGFAIPPVVLPGSFMPTGNPYPITLMADGLEDFTFPIDPLINLSFKNIITRRTVAKGKNRGTVKERWTQDDVEITISGVFINADGYYPPEVYQLMDYANHPGAVEVICDYLNQRDIFYIAIETVSLPHTKGIENQAYEIKAVSDDVFQLLIEE
ncbi:MAG: DUF6046 domain-containing protein [Bacteroidales bacterium]|nr:DUF6046 domain-containing protein [Bacteroidales bacterium]MDD3665145.1 DUF6046 domain-containing protein [Bacteroidales bacterium]